MGREGDTYNSPGLIVGLLFRYADYNYNLTTCEGRKGVEVKRREAKDKGGS